MNTEDMRQHFEADGSPARIDGGTAVVVPPLATGSAPSCTYGKNGNFGICLCASCKSIVVLTDSDRLKWLHTGGGKDAEGYEWGVFRVKWDVNGKPVEVWQTNSDYYGIFKPSIAEVLAQIPEELIEQTVAFETIGPADADALNKERDALNAGFHVATTRLYGRSA